MKSYLQDQQMEHTRGVPHRPQTQGKIEGYHRSMKNVVKLDNYYLPWELEEAIAKFVDHCNNDLLRLWDSLAVMRAHTTA
ncbi:MAG: hypothetical protein IIB42_01380 [Candidatus Marinimicrobia bacterium]|nr:hypothetical protein [Candidatus Neomarinimicrobiota bacterium]